jgi:hypothetical protein
MAEKPFLTILLAAATFVPISRKREAFGGISPAFCCGFLRPMAA